MYLGKIEDFNKIKNKDELFTFVVNFRLKVYEDGYGGYLNIPYSNYTGYSFRLYLYKGEDMIDGHDYKSSFHGAIFHKTEGTQLFQTACHDYRDRGCCYYFWIDSMGRLFMEITNPRKVKRFGY